MSSVNFLEKLLGDVEVKWMPMGDVMQMRAGQHISAENIASEANNNFPYPCFGGNGIRGFVSKNSHEGKYLIIGRQGALCGNVQRASGKFYATEHAVVVTPSNLINVDWAFHLLTMMNLNQYASKSAQPGLAVGKIASLRIPIPCPDNPKKSIQIQAEIVRILDAMTAHTAELTAELTARKKQYNYYRDKLLSFEDGEVEWKELGEIATITIGEFVHQNKQENTAEYPVFNGGRTPTGYYKKFNNTGNKIIISARGANAGFVNRISTPYWAGNSCYSIGIKQNILVDWNFIYYFLKHYESRIIGIQQKGGIPAVSKRQMQDFLVPIPNIKKQQQIVSILDKFDSLINSITEGLPREIELREKQYAYYRDLLLSFPKPPTI